MNPICCKLNLYHRSAKNGWRNEMLAFVCSDSSNAVDDIQLRANAIPYSNFEISFSKMDCVVFCSRRCGCNSISNSNSTRYSTVFCL